MFTWFNKNVTTVTNLTVFLIMMGQKLIGYESSGLIRFVLIFVICYIALDRQGHECGVDKRKANEDYPGLSYLFFGIL